MKFHTRLVVASLDETFPDKVIPSTGSVGDREVVMELVTDLEATYLFDRGYVDYGKMDEWFDKGISFAMRINDQNKANFLETYDTASDKVIIDARVVLGTKQYWNFYEFTANDPGKAFGKRYTESRNAPQKKGKKPVTTKSRNA